MKRFLVLIHMEILSKLANPIHLEKFARSLKGGRIPPRAVVVTFDDGYADNLHHGRPILEEFQIPATVFVVTGYMGKKFWWDELAIILLASQTLPATNASRMSSSCSDLTWENWRNF